MASFSPTSDIDFVINHLVLPPKLPHQGDSHNKAGLKALLDRVLSSAKMFRNQADPKHYNDWSTICRLLTQFNQLHTSDILTKDALKRALDDVRQGGILVLHVSTQNAGIIIRKLQDDYHIEAFEASARAANVLASKNALEWHFPCRSVSVPAATFEDNQFQDQIAEFLEKCQMESIKQFAAITLKAGSGAYESRDTANPAMITEVFMALLQAVGRAESSKITQKRIRDDVCWNDGAEIPWRRSPTWLVLRVGLQRSLCFLLNGTLGTMHYKFFMAFVLQELCNEICIDHTTPTDNLALINAKLGRRMAKLHNESEQAPSSIRKDFEKMFDVFTKPCQKTLKISHDVVANRWADIRLKHTKRISRLPGRADTQSMFISLTNSQRYLNRVFEQLHGHSSTPAHLQYHNRVSIPSIGWAQISFKPEAILSDYLDFADFELQVERQGSRFVPNAATLQRDCVGLSKYITQYRLNATAVYNGNPQQLSIMLLTIMELWTVLDRAVLELYPILSEYPSGFPTAILHVLQLSRFQDLKRLRLIEAYLESRHRSTKKSAPSIFDDPVKGCFAVVYFDQSSAMKDLFAEIEESARAAYQKKVLELQRTTKEYDTLMKQAAEKTCICVEYDRSDGKCPPCNKCYVIRCARRLRISVHEHPLPSDAVQAKAVVFELLCPGPFAAWRDTTWGILRDLGRQHQFPGRKPELLLENYDQLRLYASHQNHTISLASKTKSFLHTHYATIRLPVTLDKVCLPNGLSYALFDHSKLLWCASQKETPTFADHCSHRISSTSVFASIDYALHSVNGISGRSSNEIIASQTKCPNTLTLAEYTAFQDLRVGVKLQWPRLLRELISSNLNFGLEEPASLVTQLALQVGPGNGDDVRRAAHWVFEDESFCMRLISLIDQRLDASAPNWRESQTVDCLVTLLLRTWSLARSASVVSATALVIAKARTISFHWARTLRNEVLTAKDGETAHQRSADAALAALLCRRTFAVEAEQDGRNLDVHGLATYFECAIILKENLPDDFQKASAKLRQKLVNNIKLFHRMEENLLQLKDMLQNAIKEALTNIWPEAENSIARTWSAWRLMPSPFHHWMIARTTPDEAFNAQEVHFNLLEGTLLIDGRPLGKLPAEYVSHEAFQHLFGNRTFWTYPSSLPGMSHVAANLVHGHQVHFGFRDGTTFIRVRENSTVMEFIPPTVFKGTGMAEASDFPRPLIDDVVHWLDLNSHTIKIRQMSDIWKPKHNNWSVDLKKRQARRNNSTLVDTRSRLFREIGSVIEPFESLPQIVVSQSDKGVLHVQLPRLELQFVVNKQGLLESRQMRAFIDSNQDCGTFYGLASKLVLCATDNPADRSVLVTLGVPTVNRHGAHVRVAVEHPLFYCRFPINTLLGRLEPAEPRLVYLKAYYHAVTSFVSPDPLTKRTGTEEALDCLQSALAQPWSPMDTIFCNILKSIAALTPRRNHYPQDLKAMQRVNWSDQLLAAVQDDRFRPAVHSIMRQSERLQHFHQIPLDSGEFETEGSTTLSQRSALRNATYQKSVACDVALTFDDEVYNTQDRFSTLRFNNILEAVSSVSRWSRQIRVTQDLAGLLQSWPVIQGFNQPFDISLLDELVNLDFKTNLGSLFDYCRQAEYTRDKHKMMFFFAVLSSNTKVDMTTIGTLIAFCILEEFKVLSGPMWSSYTQFKDNQVPTVDMLVNLMHESRTPYPETEHTAFQSKLSWRQRKQKEEDRSNHETQSLVSCKKLAQHLLGQWPCLNPALNKCGELPLIDLDEAVASVQTEWERHFQNYELSMFIRELQKVLRTCHPPTATACFGGLDFESEYYPIRSPGHVVPTIVELLAGITLPQLPSSERVKLSCLGDVLASRAADSLNSVDSVRNNDTTEASELRRVVKTFSNDSNSVRGKYGVDLEQSIDALTRNGSGEAACTNTVDQHRLQTAIADFDQAIHKHFNSLCAHLTLDSRFQWLGHTELWPLLTPITLLCTIRSNCAIKTVKQEAIVDYALLFRACQHLHRIRLASQQNNNFKLSEELCNIRHQNWEVRGSVDWLLLEIEFDICIRPAQYEVAKAMIAPYSGSNSVLQMNMGQGKSSVIIPMLAASLADGGSLVRVIVPKPLLSQMAQILQMRLGGLLGRTIKHVPFSRRSSTKPTDIQAYLDLHQETQLNRGVMLCLPEHLLSFKLSGLHSLSSRNATEAAPMINMQAWLIGNCRDVLDECDHTLAVKTQLIYPFGSQKVVDGHPNRWKIAEAILSLVRSHLPDLYKRFPGGLEIGWRAENAFPSICIIRQAVKDALIESVVSSVLNGQGSILPVKDCSQEDLDTMTSLLRDATIPKHIRRRAMDLFKDRPSARQDVLFLRGLLVHRILLMALNKRWNVQYGLHPKRDPIAVPYQAKGVPSEQAEFGHPDVAILLTSLSFYYAGLSVDQLQQSLKQLQRSDDPSMEYSLIIQQSKNVPSTMRSWNAINVDDEAQCNDLWKCLRTNVAVIDYFLNHFVFPRHAKTFEKKLVSSGWDIPIFSEHDLQQVDKEGQETIEHGDKKNYSTKPYRNGAHIDRLQWNQRWTNASPTHNPAT